MKVVSFHPTSKAARKFAKKLRLQGAEGVEEGKRTSAGYPVLSKAPTKVTAENLRKIQESRMPEPTEKYDFETTTTPVREIVGLMEMGSRQVHKIREETLRIAKEELRKAGLADVQVVVSTYQGRDPNAPYADATWFKRGKKYRINIHPIHQYYDEDYTREVVRHEIEHILRDKEEEVVD